MLKLKISHFINNQKVKTSDSYFNIITNINRDSFNLLCNISETTAKHNGEFTILSSHYSITTNDISIATTSNCCIPVINAILNKEHIPVRFHHGYEEQYIANIHDESLYISIGIDPLTLRCPTLAWNQATYSINNIDNIMPVYNKHKAIMDLMLLGIQPTT